MSGAAGGGRAVHNGRGTYSRQAVIHPDPMAHVPSQTPIATDVSGDGALLTFVFTGRHLFAFKSQLLQTSPLPFPLLHLP